MLDWIGFTEWNYWHWLILGAALLLLELFGTAGLLLWTGIAALLTAVMVYLFALDIYGQWGLFAVFSIATTWYWFRLNQRDNPRDYQQDSRQRNNLQDNQRDSLLENRQDSLLDNP